MNGSNECSHLNLLPYFRTSQRIVSEDVGVSIASGNVAVPIASGDVGVPITSEDKTTSC